MSSQATIEPVDFFSDARGMVIEPIPEQLIPAQRNVHVVLTEPGCIRGNHYHELSTEVFTVTGSALIRVRENGVVRDISIPDGKAFRITVPPKVSHAMQNTGPRTMLMMCFNTRPHDRANPDTVKDVLIA